MLDFDLFRRVVDEAGPSLVRIDFFNYGEAFLHKRAVEMCEYIKSNFPHIYLYTSTNGLALTEAQARRLVHSGHRRGHLFDRRRHARELQPSTGSAAASTSRSQTLEAMADEKQKAGRRSAVPELALHPVQLERQRRGDGSRAGDGGRDRRRSALLGNHRPSRDRVLAAVRAGIAAPRRDSTRNLGRQRSRQRHPRRHAAGADRRADAGARRPADHADGPSPSRAHARAQSVDARRSRRRRPTAAASSGSARSCATRPARSSTAISPARGCRKRSAPAARLTCRSRSRPPTSPDATRSSSIWSAKGSTGSSTAARRRPSRSSGSDRAALDGESDKGWGAFHDGVARRFSQTSP